MFKQEPPHARWFRVVGFPWFKVLYDMFESKDAAEIIFNIQPGSLRDYPIEVDDEDVPEVVDVDPIET